MWVKQLQTRIKKFILLYSIIIMVLASLAYSIRIQGFEELRFDGALLINSTTLSIKTNDIVRMFVNSDGNVGIGTTTPSSTLTVNGNFTVLGKTNSSIGNFSIIQHNASCVGFRFGTNGGGIFSCTP